MKYIGFFNLAEMSGRNLDVAVSAQTKMEYIVQTLCQIEDKVQVISPAWTLNESGYYKQEESMYNEKTSVISLPCFGSKNRLLKKCKIIFAQWMLLVYMLKNIKREEKILVYHSLYLMFPVWIISKVKHLKLVLEVEEIYADVLENSLIKKIEMAYFKHANAYIFPTELLSEVVNIERKEEVIVHGTYKVEQERDFHFDDKKIHVVYAGTLDPRKGGALAAAAARALPSNYHIHILGFGTWEMQQHILEQIKECSSVEHATASFDGLLTGEEYISFIQACDIGLSTQNPDAQFNNTSFPSKVLSYMANGLRVVSIRIPAIEKSAVGDLITYYDIQEPKEIAYAIQRISMKDMYNSRKRIQELDDNFKKNFRVLLEKI